MNNLNKTIRTYTIGFILSIILTFIAYTLVVLHGSSTEFTISSIALFSALILAALIQLSVQLIFFLHIGEESGPKWNIVFFISTFGIILLVIIASVWIMYHLNYNMTPTQMNQYIQDQSGL